jgi:release factor glutamine methyltransferase
LLEIGPDRAAAVAGILAGSGMTVASVLPDFDGRDRVVTASAA